MQIRPLSIFKEQVSGTKGKKVLQNRLSTGLVQNTVDSVIIAKNQQAKLPLAKKPVGSPIILEILIAIFLFGAAEAGITYLVEHHNAKVKERQKRDQDNLVTHAGIDAKKTAIKEGISESAAVKKIGKEVQDVLPKMLGNGRENGLNAIMGNNTLRLGLARNVLVPLNKALNGDNSEIIKIPNGLCFFGPKGTGKTHICKALMDNYERLGGYTGEIEFINDPATDIKNLNETFETAKQNFEKSGKTKYTMILIDELEKGARKEGLDHSFPARNSVLKKLAKDAKENGVILLMTSNKLDSVDPDILTSNRIKMRIPVEPVGMHNILEMTRYYSKYIGANDANINYDEIIDALMTNDLMYKPSDLEDIVYSAKEKDGSILTTSTLKKLLTESKIVFNNNDKNQFKTEKDDMAKLGVLHIDARYPGELE